MSIEYISLGWGGIPCTGPSKVNKGTFLCSNDSRFHNERNVWCCLGSNALPILFSPVNVSEDEKCSKYFSAKTILACILSPGAAKKAWKTSGDNFYWTLTGFQSSLECRGVRGWVWNTRPCFLVWEWETSEKSRGERSWANKGFEGKSLRQGK